jgi:hypothetical protein
MVFRLFVCLVADKKKKGGAAVEKRRWRIDGPQRRDGRQQKQNLGKPSINSSHTDTDTDTDIHFALSSLWTCFLNSVAATYEACLCPRPFSFACFFSFLGLALEIEGGCWTRTGHTRLLPFVLCFIVASALLFHMCQLKSYVSLFPLSLCSCSREDACLVIGTRVRRHEKEGEEGRRRKWQTIINKDHPSRPRPSASARRTGSNQKKLLFLVTNSCGDFFQSRRLHGGVSAPWLLRACVCGNGRGGEGDLAWMDGNDGYPCQMMGWDN